jgi:hypothetical protein
MIYLDSAAVVKLVHAEPQSQALRAWPDDRAETGWISSVLVEVESFRALARHAPAGPSARPAPAGRLTVPVRGALNSGVREQAAGEERRTERGRAT